MNKTEAIDKTNSEELPFAVIINTDDCTVLELTEEESKRYRGDIQKRCISSEWLERLKAVMRDLERAKTNGIKEVGNVYNEADWVGQ
ncbi:MAG TPA: hypothetical protein VF648_00510 [Pyrinomonadaceae bacterium]|jgi:hypothetical protein